MPHRCQLTCRALQGVFREEVARLGAQFAAHHLLIQAVVAVDVHMAQMGLCSLEDAHFQVYRVANDVDLYRVYAREHVAVVVVVVMHGIVVLDQTFVQQLLVVHVARLHVQHLVQTVGSDDGVAHPGDVAQVVALSFLNLHQYVDVLLVVVPDRVFQNGHVAVAQLVVFVDECLLGFGIAFRREFLRLQESGELACLMNLSKGTLGEELSLELFVRQLFVTLECDGAHFHLRLLVNVHVEDNAVLAGHVVALPDDNFSVLVALVVEVFLGKDLGTIQHVGCHRRAFHHAQLRL